MAYAVKLAFNVLRPTDEDFVKQLKENGNPSMTRNHDVFLFPCDNLAAAQRMELSFINWAGEADRLDEVDAYCVESEQRWIAVPNPEADKLREMYQS